MSELNEFIFDYIFFPVIFLLIGLILIYTYNEEQTKSALYSECIETEYNKFECYSMIYGDK